MKHACYIFLIWAACITSCENSGEEDHTSVSDQRTIDSGLAELNSWNKDSILRVVTITSRNGAEAKEKPDTSSNTMLFYKYGDKMDVIGETAEWWIIRDYVKRMIRENSQMITRQGWEKIYLSKSATIDLTEVRVEPADLNIVSSINEGDSTRNFQNGLALRKYLQIELIDQKTFEENRTTENFIVPDPSTEKNNGIIELRGKGKTARYIDRPDAEESRSEYTFIGQVPFLNKYVISGSYYEGSDFKFIDKITCEETEIFVDFPFISPDKKHIICIYSNPYNLTADLELYAIHNTKTKKIMAASFQFWMPLYEDHQMFWGKDNYLYLTVLPAKAFWDKDGTQNTRVQFIRMKVL